MGFSGGGGSPAVFTPLAYGLNYSDFGAPFEVGAWTVSSGLVVVRGLVKKTVAVWANGDIIATLPAAQRPRARQMNSVFANDSGAGPFIARIDINPDGTIVISASAPNVAVPANLASMSLWLDPFVPIV